MRRGIRQVDRIQFTQVCETVELIEVDRFLLSRWSRLQTIIRWDIRCATVDWSPGFLCRSVGRCCIDGFNFSGRSCRLTGYCSRHYRRDSGARAAAADFRPASVSVVRLKLDCAGLEPKQDGIVCTQFMFSEEFDQAVQFARLDDLQLVHGASARVKHLKVATFKFSDQLARQADSAGAQILTGEIDPVRRVVPRCPLVSVHNCTPVSGDGRAVLHRV